MKKIKDTKRDRRQDKIYQKNTIQPVMDSLKDTNLIKFHPDTLDVVRKEYTLDVSEINKALGEIEEWIKTHELIVKKDFSKEYLERSLISNKGSVEKTKSKIERLCKYKTYMPEYFEDIDPKVGFPDVHDFIKYTIMPQLTEGHYRVYFVKHWGRDFESTLPFSFMRLMFTLIEYLKAHDYNKGFVIVIDYSEIDFLSLLRILKIRDIRRGGGIMLKGYDARLKAIHVISTSKLVNLVLRLYKLVLGKKLGSRFIVHSNAESLLEHLPKTVLPGDYGGLERPLAELHENLLNVLCSDEQREYRREMHKATLKVPSAELNQ